MFFFLLLGCSQPNPDSQVKVINRWMQIAEVENERIAEELESRFGTTCFILRDSGELHIKSDSGVFSLGSYCIESDHSLKLDFYEVEAVITRSESNLFDLWASSGSYIAEGVACGSCELLNEEVEWLSLEEAYSTLRCN